MKLKFLEILKKPIKLRFLLPTIYLLLVIFSWLILLGMKQAVNEYLIISVPSFLLLFSGLFIVRFIPFVGTWIINSALNNKGFANLPVFIISYLIPILILFVVGYLLEKLIDRLEKRKIRR